MSQKDFLALADMLRLSHPRVKYREPHPQTVELWEHFRDAIAEYATYQKFNPTLWWLDYVNGGEKNDPSE